jgi:hypothetical protein
VAAVVTIHNKSPHPKRAKYGLEEMLTKADDYPIHQTPEPVAFAGTDRNFYDRYFFNAYLPDGSAFVAIAFGIYPHLNIADAHFSVVHDGRQVNLHASRFLEMERLDLKVGPISIEIVEPLQALRVCVDLAEGISANLLFEGRHFPLQEPRFTHRIGPRTFMDYTRLTQNCRVSGWVELDGKTIEFVPGSLGTRDRSWGVRPIGSGDAQPFVPAVAPGFFWQWTPINFADRSLYFHINADAQGKPFNIAGGLVLDGSRPDHASFTESASLDTLNQSGTRWPLGGKLRIPVDNDEIIEATIKPLVRFQMKGIGYLNPKWSHGLFHGPLVVERDEYQLDELSASAMDNFHVQYVSTAEMRVGSQTYAGIGTFEQLIVGPYQPMNLATVDALSE